LPAHAPNPEGKGGFQPGKSGNPGGRPKKDERIRAAEELAKEHTEDAMNALIEIALDKAAPARARVTAAEVILDRGWGKPVERHEVGTPGEFDHLSEEEMLRRLAAEEETLAAIEKARKPAPKKAKQAATKE
jgi:HEAT repeat protein